MKTRIAAVADIHGSTKALRALVPMLADAELLLVAGDLTNFGDPGDLEKLLEALADFRGRVLAVPGNCDPQEVREELFRRGLSVDGRSSLCGGLALAGTGGALFRGGHCPYERDEEELAAGLRKNLSRLREAAARRRGLCVLSHMPPYDSGADMRHGQSRGSAALRALLDEYAPALWVCGHIHESRCARRLGESLVVNPGALSEGSYALIELELPGDGAARIAAELFSL